ncbi:MAG: hypothetical protein ACYC2H_11170 [Thermoplasmatota archaeon]
MAPTHLTLNECLGVGTLFMLPVVMTPVRSEVPPGWAGSGRILNDYRVTVVQCQRIAVGPYERGPIHVLVETHSDATPPDACMEFESGFFNYAIMRSFWLDDEELVSYLNAALNMPTRFGVFGYNETSTGSVAAYTWDWRAPGFQRSDLTFSKTEVIPGGAPEVIRMFWHDGAHVSFLDVKEDTKQPIGNPPQTHGTLSEPLMVGGTPFETNAGVFSLVEPGNYDGPIYRFGDLECKTLL